MNPTLKIQKDLSHLISNGFFLFFLLKTLGEKYISWLHQTDLEKTHQTLQKIDLYKWENDNYPI